MSLFPRDFRENPHRDDHEWRQEHDHDFRPMLTDRVLVEIGGERDQQYGDRQRGLDREGHRRSPYKADNLRSGATSNASEASWSATSRASPPRLSRQPFGTISKID